MPITSETVSYDMTCKPCCGGGVSDCNDCPYFPAALELSGGGGTVTLTDSGGLIYEGVGTACGETGNWRLQCIGSGAWALLSPFGFVSALTGPCDPYLLTGELQTVDGVPVGCSITVTE